MIARWPSLALVFVMLALFSGCASQPKPVALEKVDVVPLALDSRFQIRKVKIFHNDPQTFQPTTSEPVQFERLYYMWGAVDVSEIQAKTGHYFSFYWRAGKRADVRVRFEYRQAGTGNTVSAQEIFYPAARGSYRSQFEVTGDEFEEFGRVVAWRVLLIVEDRVVAFRQSFLW